MSELQVLLNTVTNKEITFLEGDFALYNEAGELERILIENRIRYNAVYNVGDLPLAYLIKSIEWADVICFQSRFVTRISHQIAEYLTQLKEKKIIIECFCYEPKFDQIPKGVIHDMYVFTNHKEEAIFRKLTKTRHFSL